MAKVIIGVHGLANKPPAETLEKWWKDSLIEGLQHQGVSNPDFKFRMVYWAKYLHKHRIHSDKEFDFDELYNDEPYQKANPGQIQEYKESILETLRAVGLGIVGSAVDFAKEKFGADKLAKFFQGKVLKDLAFYYDPERRIKNEKGDRVVARKLLDSLVEESIREEHEAGNEIMLIAHSMGSIISYNALRDLGRPNPRAEVSRFVTIGSPLGLFYVKSKIKEERIYDLKVRTPSIVSKAWTNYVDRRDPVALDIRLKDDYDPNAARVRVKDDLVINDYQGLKKGEIDRNAHKSYGYLRTPELSREVRSFLGL